MSPGSHQSQVTAYGKLAVCRAPWYLTMILTQSTRKLSAAPFSPKTCRGLDSRWISLHCAVFWTPQAPDPLLISQPWHYRWVQARNDEIRLDREVSLKWGAMEAETIAEPSVTRGINSSAKLRSETVLLFLLMNLKSLLFCFVEKLLKQWKPLKISEPRKRGHQWRWVPQPPQVSPWPMCSGHQSQQQRLPFSP